RSLCHRHRRQPPPSPPQACGQQRLTLLGTLGALALGLGEELGELGVTVALGVLDVALQAHGVAQAGLGEPHEVVVLVLRAGDLTGFLARHGRLLPCPSQDICPPSRKTGWPTVGTLAARPGPLAAPTAPAHRLVNRCRAAPNRSVLPATSPLPLHGVRS